MASKTTVRKLTLNRDNDSWIQTPVQYAHTILVQGDLAAENVVFSFSQAALPASEEIKTTDPDVTLDVPSFTIAKIAMPMSGFREFADNLIEGYETWFGEPYTLKNASAASEDV